MSIPPDASPPSLPDLPRMSHALERTVVDCPCLIRTVRQADLAMLSDLLASSFHSQEGWGRWLYPLLRAGIYEDLKSRLHGRSAHYACLVAVKPVMRGQMNPEVLGVLVGKGDMLVGTVELSLKTPSLLQPWNNKYLYISNLAVRAEYRHQGVAQQLLKTCERIALDWGFSGLYLHVLENNSAAQRLYDKAGYRLRRIELSPLALLLGHPRQLFLHKHLTRST